MFKRQTSGSVVCRSCGLLVGVNDEECYNCGASNPGLWGWAPILRRLGSDFGFVNFVTASCILLYILTLVADPTGIRMGGMMSFLSPSQSALFLFGASGSVPVFLFDRWWTLLSAAWLHGGLLHVGLNLYWIRQLAPPTADIYGAGRMILIYTVASIVGFAASSTAGLLIPGVPLLGGAQFTIGASAPLFGLLGALVYSGRRGGSSIVGKQAQSLALIMFVLGFIFPGVDNWAHAGGFAGGYLMSRWLDPMLPERIDHVFAAVICLGVAVLTIVISVLTGARYL